jgi:hypothetical protein
MAVISPGTALATVNLTQLSPEIKPENAIHQFS